MSDDPGHGPPPPPVRIAEQLCANASLLVAILVYMGWAYDDAFLGYFHISPLDLNVGIVEYMLRSLNLFSPGVVLVAVGVIVVPFAPGVWAGHGLRGMLRSGLRFAYWRNPPTGGWSLRPTSNSCMFRDCC